MKNRKIIAVLLILSAISLMSCNKGKVSRKEAEDQYSKIAEHGCETPDKFTVAIAYDTSKFSTESYNSYVSNGNSSSVYETASIVYSLDDCYYSLDVSGLTAKIYQKNGILYAYSSLFDISVEWGYPSDFLDAIKYIQKIDDVKSYLNKFIAPAEYLSSFFSTLESGSFVNEEYKTEGDGNLSASTSFLVSNKKVVATFNIDNYILASYVLKFDGDLAANYTFENGIALIELPTN